MTAVKTFVAFARRALTPAGAARFATLATSKKGQQKVLAGLDHDFERAIRPGGGHPVGQACAGKQPCYAFHFSLGFGMPFNSIAEAYARMSGVDGWLIVSADASTGIYRPESRWDAEVLLVAATRK
ncbi:MAG: hypothetical protein ABSH22_06540 [Tepidisphaeraceae bacterium]|jgi:hypothetical protein